MLFLDEEFHKGLFQNGNEAVSYPFKKKIIKGWKNLEINELP